MASNNEITPEVKHRVGEHICVYVNLCMEKHGMMEKETKMFV